MALSWSGRRKALYTSVVSIIALMLLIFIYQSLFTAPPLCTDRKQNGGELGVDCGGPCSLLCTGAARAPVVIWARAFETAPQIYTAAAYVQNNNLGSVARQVGYSFQLFDAENKLVVARDGVADLSPVPTVPIIETGINAGHRTVARTIFSFSTEPVWLKAGGLPALSASKQSLSPDGSRLSATIRNDSLVQARATIAAVLFDAEGVARAASKSTVTIPARGETPVVLTWGLVPQEPIVRAEITILPL
ncbi:MAG: hypothetical protein JWL87_8 [Candidatus Adlerbacteria bacterium]|nr:hypothetical protein [Candidatus Adlerbacteria bacterium]